MSKYSLDIFDLKILKSEQNSRKDFLINKEKELTFEEKEKIALSRIKSFLKQCQSSNTEKPIIAFSGGKDSCVVRHLVHRIDPNIKSLTAAELFHPEIAKFLKTIDDTTFVKPYHDFEWIVNNVGYPVLSKEVAEKINNVRTSKTLGNWTLACFGLKKSRKIPKSKLHFLDETLIDYKLTDKCCFYLKGKIKTNKTPQINGTTVFESQLRRTNWLKNGCIFESVYGLRCRPISLWRDEDIWKYIKKYNIPYSKAYDMGWLRTGCIACGFGLSFEQKLSEKGIAKSRYELLYEHYPSLYKKYMYGKINMYKPLADAGIKINVPDERYQEYFNKRQRLIEEWYSDKNFLNNLNKILDQIENRTNTKIDQKTRSKIIKEYI